MEPTKSYRRSTITCSPLVRQVSDLTLDFTSSDSEDENDNHNDDSFACDHYEITYNYSFPTKASLKRLDPALSSTLQEVRMERCKPTTVLSSSYHMDRYGIVSQRSQSRLSSTSNDAVCHRQIIDDYDDDDDDKRIVGNNFEIIRSLSDASLRTLGSQRFQSSSSSSGSRHRDDLGPKKPQRRSSIGQPAVGEIDNALLKCIQGATTA